MNMLNITKRIKKGYKKGARKITKPIKQKRELQRAKMGVHYIKTSLYMKDKGWWSSEKIL